MKFKFETALLIMFTLLSSGCASIRVDSSGEGQGAVGLAKLGVAIQRTQAKFACSQGIIEERREVRTIVTPQTDPMKYDQRPISRTDMVTEIRCR